jgi:tetratricopeptide (TPR) repeat protein
MSHSPVQAWRQKLTIPTYRIGQPDRNPMFLDKRVYQGSSGKVYPLPVIEHIADDKQDVEWDVVFLENEYLKIMVIPALGGRVQMALDKTNDYHFVYYNRVIKPALVGLAGPWISGGIEFNWPQHHRPNTYGPVDSWIEQTDDGSAIVWCSEIDRMSRTKGMHGLTLRPGKAYLEIQVKLYNRTDTPQTFLWWANPAIRVDEHHQSIFPPDVHAVMDHGKRDVSSFPIATGTYYKVDYSPGTDISRYKNIPVPTSYMAYHSDYNFVGSYDHGRQAGLLHVANHHISPGKKQWTWGNGDFGYAWDRHLTDEDGPYIELMCGVYTDNQPDFTWLMSGEEKSFTQYFMPYKGVGRVCNAAIDAAVGLEIENGCATVKAYTTSEQLGARLVLRCGEQVMLDEVFDGSPRRFKAAMVNLIDDVDAAQLHVEVLDAQGKRLVDYQPYTPDHDDIPDPAKAIPAPAEVDSTESLYLAGLHLEQYRHATRRPEDYYTEALERDPGDIRNNNALGLLLYRRGCFADAERHFRTAIERLTRHNPNPCDSEAYYHLGLTLEAQGRFDDAFDAYYKATWSAAQQKAAFFALARIACRRGEWCEAMGLLDRCLERNAAHHRARHLKVVALQQLGRADEARTLMDESLALDPFNIGVLYEQAADSGSFDAFDARIRLDSDSYLELAMQYVSAGLDEEAATVLQRHIDLAGDSSSALIYYHLAAAKGRVGHAEAADQLRAQAAQADPYGCFPHRLESIAVLQEAMEQNPGDARAPYYLGNLWYDKKQYAAALACWRTATDRDPAFPTVWRNLGLIHFNQHHDGQSAWQAFSRAFELDPTDARVLFEWDQLAKRLGHAPQDRLDRLEAHRSLVDCRDDLYLEYIALLNVTGRSGVALDVLLARQFHPWEGGEGKVPAQYTLALTQLARAAIDAAEYDRAMALLDQAQNWPHSLGEGKLAGIQENSIHYLMGVALVGKGDDQAAQPWFETAAVGLSEPTSAMYYNDQPPDMIYYQGLAQRALGCEAEAVARFERLITYGREHLDDEVTIDYFAVSLPDFLVFEEDLGRRNQIHCRYMMALGLLGLGKTDEAAQQFNAILAVDPAHAGAVILRP